MKVKFKWETQDGYIGGSRPQYVFIDESEIAECEDEEELQRIIENAVQDDFEQKIQPEWDNSEVEKVKKAWEKLRLQI